MSKVEIWYMQGGPLTISIPSTPQAARMPVGRQLRRLGAAVSREIGVCRSAGRIAVLVVVNDAAERRTRGFLRVLSRVVDLGCARGKGLDLHQRATGGVGRDPGVLGSAAAGRIRFCACLGNHRWLELADVGVPERERQLCV